jgi:hypothetical protein
VQVLMFDAGEKPHPTRPGETVHVWRLMAQERDPERRPVRRDPPPAPVVTEQSRDAHRDELAARFQPDTEIPF